MAHINRRITIVIAETDCFLAAGLASLLGKQYRVKVAAVDLNCLALTALCMQHQPDVIILDGGLLYSVEELTLAAPSAAIILYERHAAPPNCNGSLANAVSGIVYMGQPAHILLQAIKEVYYGGTYHCSVTRQLITGYALQQTALPAACEKVVLSDRHLEVLQYVAQQKSSKQIAALLFLAVSSVNSIRSRLRQITKTENTAGLVAYALRHKLISCTR